MKESGYCRSLCIHEIRDEIVHGAEGFGGNGDIRVYGIHEDVIRRVIPEEFSRDTLDVNYGEVSDLSVRLIDEPGFMFLAAKESLLTEMDNLIRGKRRFSEGNAFNGTDGITSDTGEEFKGTDVTEEKESDAVYAKGTVSKCEAFNYRTTEMKDYMLNPYGLCTEPSGNGTFAEPGTALTDDGYTELNPLREFSGCGASRTDSLGGLADAGMFSTDGNTDVSNLKSREVFELFDVAERADTLASVFGAKGRHGPSGENLWSGGKSRRHLIRGERDESLDAGCTALREALSSVIGRSSCAERKRFPNLIRGLGKEVPDIIRDCLEADGLTDAVYGGLRYMTSGGSGRNGGADCFRADSADPYFPIKLDEFITAGLEKECNPSAEASSETDRKPSADGYLPSGYASYRMLLDRLYRNVFMAEAMPPKHLAQNEEAEFINGYITDIVLARIMFAVMNVAADRGCSLEEYIAGVDAEVKRYGEQGIGAGARIKNKRETVSRRTECSKGTESRAFMGLSESDITADTGFMKLGAVCPENLKRLRLFDELVNAEISGRKYDGAAYEMAGNISAKGFPILCCIYMLINSLGGDLRNKARCLRTNLGLLLDESKFNAFMRIPGSRDVFAEDGKKKITNLKKLTQRQEHRFRHLCDLSLYVAAMVLCVFSETELLFNGRTTLTHLLRAADNLEVVKRKVKKHELMRDEEDGVVDTASNTPVPAAIPVSKRNDNTDSENDRNPDKRNTLYCPGGSSDPVREIKNKSYAVKFRVLDVSELNNGIEGLVLRIRSKPRIELMYLAIMTILTLAEPEREYMDILARKLDRWLPEIASGKKVLLLQWRYREKKKKTG